MPFQIFQCRSSPNYYSFCFQLVKQYNIPNDMLPTKKLFSNMSLVHLEKRRNALEHYLQRLINRLLKIGMNHVQIIPMSKFKSGTVEKDLSDYTVKESFCLLQEICFLDPGTTLLIESF